MHTLDDTSHPAKIEPALPIQAAEKKQTGSDTVDFSLSPIAYLCMITQKRRKSSPRGAKVSQPTHYHD